MSSEQGSLASPAVGTNGSSNGHKPKHVREQVDAVTIRFAGDSGDGMQLAGTQFTNTSALAGNDIATFPDFPAEIRAPAGTLAGVSGFQVHFSASDIHTPGDALDALVVMNPAALKTNLKDLKSGGILIANTDNFGVSDLDKARYKVSPLEDGSLAGYRVVRTPVAKLTRESVAEFKLSPKEADRCKNFFALGLVYWLYERPLDVTLKWIREKFAKNPQYVAANTAALKAGYNYGETVELLPVQYQVAKAKITPGTYRKITGNEAAVLGLAAAAQQAGKTLVYGSYPITPASGILEGLAELRRFGVKTFQAEDEIAAIGVAIGASYGGAIGVTGTSGPGVCLKSEAINLAVMTELPLVVVNVQRGGPSTGLPTKTEQSDLLQCMFGRNGDSPVAIVAPQSPVDCFDMAIEAVRIATEFMCPIFYLSDGYIANGSEPWNMPKLDKLPKIDIKHATATNADGWGGPGHENGEGETAKGEAGKGGQFLPYKRDEKLARPWAVPGTPGLEHRIGGIEKQDVTGNINYEPGNHEHMTRTRAKKIENIALTIPDLEVTGDADADLLVVGWGGTYGSITTAVERSRKRGLRVAQVHFRYLNPMPKNTEAVLKRFKKILVPELNSGQLTWLLRAKYLAPAEALSKVQGKPFLVSEIEAAIENMLK
ncbi:2-oxoglutarate ferredoxin oxidoreductase subunit alpha : 2-oxoacid:acceptor oxidoreductase, alpha subunit OS=Planctomyces brasiliensis (strain ATCC 49424 / DSM 5305 / JCM 21570 / NBRC 103401 / IFAM 1448) GN=Plabr_2853 PE=4 SV=1: POR: POR_N [Gemmataceae bacterium]|nr:2-oxoglutarate ferredoxin oxidoreductase subunit alpha : 2-oxoacid:acceptor oxidoreductase, alpha subunit OS=Planctomyces brasiliensis (strain ATCC 49424 / DSM 5305 / JCM 21570 / NBRC 103401 / IFAM 1448) GN=Plabr_2853 PE=4 SV=1: POR: POR_N [Gemmataceae bacterium]VTT96432.1 2-oxoglutarate ferredoxin oxidoreductase subunit alpha : 2-oxoacid:acceptor oxidoreductase, alpha subunit OS=Planctomyces brasiliensis (strain ATCC 49424 / DSM 5305 / JCM 21570 / NBRC 103401 / IFAM 1448) GN=Plabr_2853 PE=4 SV